MFFWPALGLPDWLATSFELVMPEASCAASVSSVSDQFRQMADQVAPWPDKFQLVLKKLFSSLCMFWLKHCQLHIHVPITHTTMQTIPGCPVYITCGAMDPSGLWDWGEGVCGRMNWRLLGMPEIAIKVHAHAVVHKMNVKAVYLACTCTCVQVSWVLVGRMTEGTDDMEHVGGHVEDSETDLIHL